MCARAPLCVCARARTRACFVCVFCVCASGCVHLVYVRPNVCRVALHQVKERDLLHPSVPVLRYVIHETM